MKKGAQKLLILLIILAFVTPKTIFASDTVDKYSKSSILIDQGTGRVLYEKEPDAKRPLASLSKMMTFLIAIEAIENKEVNPNDIIKIDKDMAKVRGSSYHLKEGEEVPLIELMKGLMIVSGNDASIGIAKHISKDEKTFVERMNKRAKELGMVNTFFVNPNGLPIYSLSEPTKPPMQNLSSARDIALLAKYMMDNYEKQVTSITDMATYTNPQRNFEKCNTNVLLRMIPEVDGIKTGYTGNAGYCLSFSMKINKNEDNERDRRVIGVVLGANHKNKRTSAAVSMLNYAKKEFCSKTVINKNEFIGKKYIKEINDLEVTLVTEDELYTVLNKNEHLNSQMTFKEVTYPVKKGDVLGVIKYYTDSGEILGSVNIISENNVDKASIINRIKMLLHE